VAFKEHFERFVGDLSVEKEIIVVQGEKDGACRGCKVAEMAALDAEGSVTPRVGYGEGVMVNLGDCLATEPGIPMWKYLQGLSILVAVA
jgi:hypothetical protein